MKKEINELLQNGGSLKINKYCTLRRALRNCVGMKIDSLDAWFDFGIGRANSCIKIEARDFQGIVAELEAAQYTAFKEAADEFARCVKTGQLGIGTRTLG